MAEALVQTIRRIAITYHLESQIDIALREGDDMADMLRGQGQLFSRPTAFASVSSKSIHAPSHNNNREDRTNSKNSDTGRNS